MSKHTSKEWRVKYTDTGICKITPNDGHGAIAAVRLRASKTNNVQERGSNARLIAQAPAMYEALEEADRLLNLIAYKLGNRIQGTDMDTEKVHLHILSILEKI